MQCYTSCINVLTLLILTNTVISATIPSGREPTRNLSNLSNSYYLSYPSAAGAIQPARGQSAVFQAQNESWTLSSDDWKNYNYLNQEPARNNLSVSSSIRRDDSFLNSLPSFTIPPPNIRIPFHSDLGVGSLADTGKVPESTVLVEPDATEPPVKGAIDYVLLPLLLMGVAGPLFVVMYVVVASIESKLPPNNQLKKSGRDYARHLQTHYLDMTSMLENAQPFFSILVTSMSRAIDSDQCKEQIACRLSSYAKDFKSFSLFHYFENVIAMFVPRRYAKSYTILTAKSNGEW